MSERTLTLDIEDNIAKITMNKPERKNALDKEMINLWVSALDECKESKEVKAIILTGAGDAFCAGGDKANLGANNKIDPLETKNHFWDHFQRVAKKTAEIEKPIIAAVNGMATGAGMDMSLHCDIRFAAKSAFFRASYAAFGLVPGNGGTYFLPRIVGASKALELFWSTDIVKSDEALRIGLVNKVFDDDILMEETIRSLLLMMKLPTKSKKSKTIKQIVRSSLMQSPIRSLMKLSTKINLSTKIIVRLLLPHASIKT